MDQVFLSAKKSVALGNHLQVPKALAPAIAKKYSF